MEIIVKHFNDLTNTELYEILKTRVEIFVCEQNCAYKEVDNKDKNAFHIIIKNDNQLKAYARVLDKNVSFLDVSIGRVLTTDRGSGYGSLVMKEAIKVAKEKFNADSIVIEAQCYAEDFYTKLGFKRISEDFLEDGIPHLKMKYVY